MTKKLPTTAEKSKQRLLSEIDELRAQLEELQQTVNAIRNGEVDALVLESEGKPGVYTLEGNDFPYRSIVETMAAGAVTINEDYAVLYCNTYFINMLGARMEQTIGSSFLDVVPLNCRKTFINFARSHAQKSIQELRLKTASGKDLDVHLAVARDLRDQHRTCIVVTDISARKAAEAALREAYDKLEERVEERTKEFRQSEKRLRRFYDSGLLGVIYWDTDGTIVDANHRFLEMLGYTRKDIVAGKINWRSITPAEYRALDKQGMTELKRTRVHNMPVEKEFIRKDGSRIPVLVAAAMLDEVRFCGVGFVLDITERKHAEEELAANSSALEETNIALRVLLKQREGDKSELEESILSNVNELILPHIDKLKRSRLDAAQASTLNLVEGNLREITSPIVKRMQAFDLTPMEIEVVSYLKIGKTSKKIAELLDVSPRTVEFHRYNIRKKLGLDQKKMNLRSYLLSM